MRNNAIYDVILFLLSYRHNFHVLLYPHASIFHICLYNTNYSRFFRIFHLKLNDFIAASIFKLF
jgi:hypothetical protein